MGRLSFFMLLSVVMSTSAWANTSSSTTLSQQGLAPETNLNIMTSVGALVLVIGVILLLAWLLKRMQVPAMKQQQGLSIVRQLSVGSKERVAVIQAGEEQFLVGITTQSIQLIAKLDAPLTQAQSAKMPFATQFAHVLNSKSNKTHDK